jgi:hypothetical protein
MRSQAKTAASRGKRGLCQGSLPERQALRPSERQQVVVCHERDGATIIGHQ